MKIKIWIFFLLVFPVFLSAQSWKVNWGEYHKFKFVLPTEHPLIGTTNHHYFVYFKRKSKREIHVYDFNHKRIETITLKNEDGKKIEPEGVIKTTSGYFLITSIFYRREKVKFVYVSPIKKNGDIEFSTERLFTYSQNKNYPLRSIDLFFMNSTNQDAYGFDMSPDSTKIIFSRVHNSNETLRTAGNDNYFLFVFDQDFNKLWEKQVTLPKSDRNIDVKQFSIDNQGEVTLIAKKRIKKREWVQWKPNYDIHVFRINENGIFNHLELWLNDEYIINATSFCDEKGFLYIGGIYTIGAMKFQGPHGVYAMKYNKDGQLIYSKKHPFEENLQRALKPSYFKKGDIDFFNFDIKFLAVDYYNNNYSIVMENRYTSSWKTPVGDDFLIPSLSFNGDLNWIQFKSRNSDNLSSPPSKVFFRNNQLYVMYNCKKSLQERKKFKDRKKSVGSNIYTDIFAIDLNGEIFFDETIFYSRVLNALIVPQDCMEIDENRILIYSKDKNGFQYGVLEFVGR